MTRYAGVSVNISDCGQERLPEHAYNVDLINA